MSPSIVTASLLASLVVVMFGLGMTLTPADFRRVAKAPKATLVALAIQLLALPAICLGLVLVFDLAPPLAVGMMLLAAAPGGTTANLYSHLAGGDVALNITLTAINSVLSVITLPVVVNLSIAHFMGDGTGIGLQPDKTLQVIALVLAPVAVGMWVHHRFRPFAERIRHALKITSIVILVLVILAALLGNLRVLLDNLVSVGSVALLLSAASLGVGYAVPRLMRIERRQAIASAFEIGIHNATLAITVAAGVLQSQEIAVPPAIYGVVMYVPAALCCYLFSRQGRTSSAERAVTA